MALSSVMEQAMTILAVEEADSSSTPRLKCRRCYINYDREAVNSFEASTTISMMIVCTPIILSLKVPHAENSFPKHYYQA
jgi:hypothetical protein